MKGVLAVLILCVALTLSDAQSSSMRLDMANQIYWSCAARYRNFCETLACVRDYYSSLYWSYCTCRNPGCGGGCQPSPYSFPSSKRQALPMK